ncbi:hypothetical protein TNCV_306801 [Trichonephila clavipes]|nr:hypothetical protein TNCV_306801 [Trichonephila clavipes]
MISIDRVKPAFLESDLVQPPVVTETVRSDKPCIPVTRETTTRTISALAYLPMEHIDVVWSIVWENAFSRDKLTPFIDYFVKQHNTNRAIKRSGIGGEREDDIEELIMGHEDVLTTEEFQEILNEEHQETQRNVSPSEQEEDER